MFFLLPVIQLEVFMFFQLLFDLSATRLWDVHWLAYCVEFFFLISCHDSNYHLLDAFIFRNETFKQINGVRNHTTRVMPPIRTWILSNFVWKKKLEKILFSCLNSLILYLLQFLYVLFWFFQILWFHKSSCSI